MRTEIQAQDDGSTHRGTCMETTCQLFTTLNTLNLSLRRGPTVFVMMLLKKQYQWESC